MRTPDPLESEVPPPPATRAPWLDPVLAVEAAFAFALAGLLCWNAWPWIAAHGGGPGGNSGERTGAVVAALLLYGLAWPAIAAATMGALRFALARLDRSTRLVIVTLLLVLVLGALAGRVIEGS